MLNEKELDEMLSTPSQALIEDMKRLDGDIMILGAGGKMGPTLALLANRAVKAAGVDKKVYAVSRFSDPIVVDLLKANKIEIISADLTKDSDLEKIPYAKNIIYMAGKKFGTDGNESETWAMNASVPTLITRKFKNSSFVAFSTGNVYPIVPLSSGGCTEKTNPEPIGEYAMSSLARERIFEHAAKEFGSKALIYRLNYAVDLRYGVLYDLSNKIINGEPISVNSPAFNCVWQGYANEVALRSLLHTSSPASFLNVTGPETVSVEYAAKKLGEYLGKQPLFEGAGSNDAYINNAAKCFELFGYPLVTLNTMIKWQAEWVLSGGRALGKPTHFEERKGSY